MVKETKDERQAREAKSEADRDLLSEITTFVMESEAADSSERQNYVEDLKFAYVRGAQWTDESKRNRTNRPSYEFNRVIQPINQVIGEQRMNRASIRVRGTDDQADPDVAEVFSGMIRNIESMSAAPDIYDMSFKNAVAGGYGVWRVAPRHVGAQSFDQEIRILPIHNVLTVYFDPLSMDPVKRDQKRCAIEEIISHDDYEAKYGKKITPADIQFSALNNRWITTDTIRVAEFFKMIPVKKEIALMSDGRVVDFNDELKKIQSELEGIPDAPTVKRTRVVDLFKVRWWLVDGNNILEGPIDYDWQYIPVIKLPGRYVNIEGKQLTQSLHRHSKDAQRVYNYNRTTMSEVVGNTPRQPYMVTAAMIKGYENQWNQSGSANRPYLLYNPDPKAPAGAASPQRVAMAEVPTALVTMAAQDADDIKATTGFHDTSLGRQGNEISGEAIKSRARIADVGSYEFFDNYRKAIQFTGDILVGMIPTVYDTPRVIRIEGLDGVEDFVKINAYDDATDKNLDLSKGVYDTTVDVGPAFSTQREESFSRLLEAFGAVPGLAEVAGDLLMKSSDVQESDEIVKRMRSKMIANGTIEPTEEEKEKAGPPPPPDPVQTALVESESTKADLNKAKTAETVADTQKTVVETSILQSQTDIKTKQLQSDLTSSTMKSIQDIQGTNNE